MIYTVTFNPAIDYVVRTDGPFVPGQVNRSAQEDYQFGGKGINVSLMLARLDCPSVALGFVAGATGSWLEQGLQAQGLHSDWIHLPGGMTRINVKIKAQTESELNGRGPDITPEAMGQLYAKLDALREGDILVLAGSLPGGLPSDTYRRILDRLAGRGIRAAVDTAGEALAAVLPARPFLIKPNHCELTALAGRPLTTQTEIEAAARGLQRQGAHNVLVSMAGDGALLVDETGAVHRMGCPQGRVVNSVGAGDSMLAGFLAGWLQSGDYACALRLGTACGSATAFSLGLADRAGIDRLLRTLQHDA